MSTLLEGHSLLSLAAFTHEYAPLEQIQGTGTEPQSDIYALGATLYHLLTGTTPISASKRDEVLHREHRDHLPLAHEVNPAIPKAISEVISRAMAIRSWERLASAKVMRSLLSESGSQTEKLDSVNSRNKSIRPSPMPFPDDRRPSAESMHMIPAKVAAKIGSSARRGVVAGGLLVLVTALAIGAVFRFPQWFTKSEVQKPPTEASPSPVQNKAAVPITPRHLKPTLLRPAHRGTIWSVAYSPDGKYIASASDDMKILLWETDNWDELGKELAGHTGPVYSVAFSPDGKTLASASEDGSIRLWDTSTRLSTTLAIDEKQWPILRVTFSPNGEYLASCASRDVRRGCEELRIWEMRDRTPRNVNGKFSEVHAIGFSPDSSVLATVGLDRQMRLWDVRTGGEKGTQSFDEMLTSVSFFRENGLMACGASDGTIRFWRYDLPHINPGKPLQAARYKPEKAVNVVVAASPDNKTLASVVPGEEIRLWDIQSRDFTSLSGQKIKRELWSLAFSPDGQKLISGGNEMVVTLWQ